MSATSRRRTARSSAASAHPRSTAARSRPAAIRASPQPRNAAERRAARWYRLRGHRILATNVWIAGNEVDLIARRGDTVVFCEVKSKSGVGFGDPVEMVTAEKQRRLRRAAEAWLVGHPECAELTIRFDVVVERRGRLERVRAAF